MTVTELSELGMVVFASLSLCAAMVYWLHYSQHPEEGDWLQSVVKTSAITPIALALLVDALLRGDPLWVIALGLTLGGCGDYLLSRNETRALRLGMLAFALGHLAYVAGLWWRSAHLATLDPVRFGFGLIPAWQIWAILGVAALILTNEAWLIPRTGALTWAVRGYGLVFGAMAVTAILLPANDGTRIIQAGTALFVLSDLLLGARVFVVKTLAAEKLLGATLWPAYVVGQGLIVFGSFLFFAFPNG